MKYTSNVIGATGLVGTQLVNLLLGNDNFKTVRIFVRRGTGLSHPKLEECIIDFTDENTWGAQLTGDVLFSALGTTLKQAGSKEKQYDIDVVFNRNFALKAKQNGIENYVLVSSIGADAKSKIFYLHIKGKLDDTVMEMNFKNPVILRPSSLTGPREGTRIAEKISVPVMNFLTKFMLTNYRPIHAAIVAKAMISSVINPGADKVIWEGKEIFELACEK